MSERRYFFGSFRRKKAVMQEPWVHPRLSEVFDHLGRVDLEYSEVDRIYERLDRNDYQSDTAREALRPRLRELERTRERLAQEAKVVQELETLVNHLLPHHAEVTARATSIIEAIQRSPDLPTREMLTSLSLASQDAELLRRTLFEITKDTKFARPVDYIDLVRFHWFQQNTTRERALLNVTSPGHRPRRSEPAPWAGQLQRIAELRAASKEEMTHAR
jgi:hypothetical protein